MGKDRVEKDRGRRTNVVKRSKRSISPFYAALGAIAVVGAALIAYNALGGDDAPPTTSDLTVSTDSAQGWVYGDPDAPIQIVEFGDFECPGCEQFSTVTEPDVKRRIVDAGLASFRFYDFPLPQHRNSLPASNAAACASDQNKYWEMHDKIFQGQADWQTGVARNPKGIFERYAREIGLNVTEWERCYDARRHQGRILANKREGERLGVSSTPTFIVGRQRVVGPSSYDAIKALVDAAKNDSGAVAAPTGASRGDAKKEADPRR